LSDADGTLGEAVHCWGLYCLTALMGVYVAGLYPNGALSEVEDRAEDGVCEGRGCGATVREVVMGLRSNRRRAAWSLKLAIIVS
jgi:hypothetical protein